MPRVTFRAESQHVTHPHYYAVFRPDGDAAWLDHLADIYVALRSTPRSPLPESVFDGIEMVERATVERILATATVPRLQTGDWRDIVRADLGEVIAYQLLEQEFGTQIAYKLVRDRELIRMPGRGVDAIGAEPFSASVEALANRGTPPSVATEADVANSPILVLVEAKVSDEEGSPPRVVDGSDDSSMRNQHRGHISEWPRTREKVWLAVRNATEPETVRLLTNVALRLERDMESAPIVACCVLVRPIPRVADTDCGTFRTKPNDYAPTRVRFLTVALPAEMAATLVEWDVAIERAIARQGGGAEGAAT